MHESRGQHQLAEMHLVFAQKNFLEHKFTILLRNRGNYFFCRERKICNTCSEKMGVDMNQASGSATLQEMFQCHINEGPLAGLE